MKFLLDTHMLPFHALRAWWRRGYEWSHFRSDVMAGLVVGTVALPLGMALAIASGVPPQHGLYTVIIAGAVVALVGGSNFQVTGPTAAFVVILVPIVTKFGVSGLLIAELMAGILLMAMGALRLGKLIEHVPTSVTLGFTAGIGLVIATLQLKDFFGLSVASMPDRYLGRLGALASAAPSFHGADLLIGALTLAALVLWPKINRRVPAPLVVLTFVTVACVAIKHVTPSFQPSTIGSRFNFIQDGRVLPGIPRQLPRPSAPWGSVYDKKLFVSLFPAALKIALLGAIESLLSAVVADRMTNTRHNPDAELLALGTGNVIAPFFGGIPATGAIARTATNIGYGAQSPIASFIHAVFVLLVMLIFAPVVAYLPMAALAALLMLVAYNMADVRETIGFFREGGRSERLVLATCFVLTVLYDMVIGVTAGLSLYALLHATKRFALTMPQLKDN